MVSETTKLGAVNPATVTKWKSNVDSTTTSISLESLMERQDAIMQASGKEADTIVTGVKQYRNFYLELQNQVRYSGDGGLQGADAGSLRLGVNKLIKHADDLAKTNQ